MNLIRRLLLALAFAGLLAACERATGPAPTPAAPAGPAGALQQLLHDLRRNDLAGYARHAVPPELHARLAIAWREGRTVWPLTELPLDDRIGGMIAALAAPDAERTLQAAFQRQFAGADAEMRSAASTLGLFAAQYVASAEEYGEDERDHHVQLIAAFSQWGQRAPLADARRAKKHLPRLVAAARLTGLGSPDAFADAGMERTLGRLGPFLRSTKQVLVDYGLDLDATLDGADVTLAQQTGGSARLRLRYRLAGKPIDAFVQVERRGDRWYLSDLLRRAEAELAPDKPSPTTAANTPAAMLPPARAR